MFLRKVANKYSVVAKKNWKGTFNSSVEMWLDDEGNVICHVGGDEFSTKKLDAFKSIIPNLKDKTIEGDLTIAYNIVPYSGTMSAPDNRPDVEFESVTLTMPDQGKTKVDFDDTLTDKARENLTVEILDGHEYEDDPY